MRGLVVGPLGFEPRTDGLKVSGSSLKTAPKMHEKCTKLQENAQTRTNSHKNADLRPPSRYKILHMATHKKGWKLRSQAKRAHVC